MKKKIQSIIIVLSILCLTLLVSSCNKVIEEVQARNKKTITYSDFSYDVDSKNRRGYVDTLGKPMTGHYIVLRDSVIAEEFQVKDGFLNGVHNEYQQGQLIFERNYERNVKHGIQRSYWDEGPLKTEVTYEMGKRSSDLLGFSLEGDTIYRKMTEDRKVYEHFYTDGKRRATKFRKDIDGKKYYVVIVYDLFENVEAIFGKDANSNKPVFYEMGEDLSLGEEITDIRYFYRAMELFSVLNFDE